jgi:hypothetical protein
VAEGAGFEPAIRFPVYTLSRRAPSTARPPLLIAPVGAKERAYHRGPQRRKSPGSIHGEAAAVKPGSISRIGAQDPSPPRFVRIRFMGSAELELGLIFAPENQCGRPKLSARSQKSMRLDEDGQRARPLIMTSLFHERRGATRMRFICRLIGLALLAGAFAAAVIDGARSIAASRLIVTSLGSTLYAAFPNKMPLLQPFIERQIHPFLWNPILYHVLLAPNWAVLGLVAVILLYALRKRPPPIGYSERDRWRSAL